MLIKWNIGKLLGWLGENTYHRTQIISGLFLHCEKSEINFSSINVTNVTHLLKKSLMENFVFCVVLA